MENVKEYFVIEMHNSHKGCPDYLFIGKKGHIKWIAINTKAGNFQAQKEIALAQASQFDDEKCARKKVRGILGQKFKYRVTRHYKYVQDKL